MLLLAVLSGLLIVAFTAGVGWAWWQSGRSVRRPWRTSRSRLDAQAALWRHPAGRARWPGQPDETILEDLGAVSAPRVTGPDDDPEFISALERRIRGEEPET